MNKEIITEIKELYSSIDHCIDQLINSRASHDDVAISNAQHKMESLMVETQQVLSRINDSLIEPVSEGLEAAAKASGQRHFPDAYNIWARPNIEAIHAELAFKEGANWQKRNLWNDAQGDNLPDYDREVVVLLGKWNGVDLGRNMRVAFGHRPDPNGWDGKSLTTGKHEHYDVKSYDKGGWSIPDVKFWLDAGMPKMDEDYESI